MDLKIYYQTFFLVSNFLTNRQFEALHFYNKVISYVSRGKYSKF
jgi:hypothetical protein